MSDKIPFDHGFIRSDSAEKRSPHAFVQWKGTDVCMDFYCDCGAHCHFDGNFAYAVKCPHCQTIWEMPCFVFPRKADDQTYPGHVEFAKMLEADEDRCDYEGNALPVEDDTPGEEW